MATVQDTAGRGDLAEVQCLVEEDPRLGHAFDDDSWLPLLRAAGWGHAAVAVMCLLDQGARINVPWPPPVEPPL